MNIHNKSLKKRKSHLMTLNNHMFNFKEKME